MGRGLRLILAAALAIATAIVIAACGARPLTRSAVFFTSKMPSSDGFKFTTEQCNQICPPPATTESLLWCHEANFETPVDGSLPDSTASLVCNYGAR
jgi:hypothetical protein